MATLQTLASTVKLSNDVAVPCIGFGVWDSKPEVCVQSCLTALRTGYRHIDTGDCYGNESQVGEAVQACNVPRSDIFIATKILFAKDSPEETYKSVVVGIERLAGGGSDAVVDLVLVHNAAVGDDQCKQIWLTLEKLYREGRIRAIGVSNHGVGHLERMKGYATVWPPHVNQLELHPWCQQRDVVTYCRQQGIVIEAYSPLARNTQATNSVLVGIATAHHVSPAQVLVRWSLQKGFIPLPKSDTPARIVSNADVFGFVLTTAQMDELNGLDRGAQGALVLAVENA